MYLKSPACCGPAFSQALMAPKLAAGAETLAEERNAEQQCRQCLNENYVAIGCLNPAFLRWRVIWCGVEFVRMYFFTLRVATNGMNLQRRFWQNKAFKICWSAPRMLLKWLESTGRRFDDIEKSKDMAVPHWSPEFNKCPWPFSFEIFYIGESVQKVCSDQVAQ